MEPVPETERMEEFRSSPLPSLRLQSPLPIVPESDPPLRKPPNIRRSTDPSPSSPSSFSWHSSSSLPFRPRTTSPLSGHGHARSRSAASLAPPMSRTQSMPGVNGSGHLLYSPQLRPQSPSRSPSRVRSPRKPVDEAFPTSPVRTSVLDPDRSVPAESSSSSPNLGATVLNTVSARQRQPSSPHFRHTSHSSVGSLPIFPSTPSSSSSSPLMKGTDALSSSYGGASAGITSSSVPSTPTSTRSRSPSISSLETIPDSPDAEEAAMEAERIAQLKAAADAAEGSDSSEGRGRSSLDVPSRGRTLGLGPRDKRKRWSVCGAERRGDLDLETIWED